MPGSLELPSMAFIVGSLAVAPAPAGSADHLHPAIPYQGRIGVGVIADRTYRDGTYTATGQYGSGPSFLPVTVDLSGGMVTRVDVGTPATNAVSLDYQRRFAAAVPRLVVGRPIDQIKVGRLAGSSLTPDGFNAALAQIREAARR